MNTEELSNQTLINRPTELEDSLKSIPSEAGCYIFKDSNDRLLYVGKSKSLRNRVRSYFRNNSIHSPRINLMIRQVNNIEFIVTDSESEALTLEANLIKNQQPYFNILLKDDKKYPYICITWSEEYPRIFITRRRRQRNQIDRFYGPFVDVTLLRKTLFLIKRSFPLRQRPRPLYKDRTCLNYSIGRCPGVCQGKISSKDYHNTLMKIAMIFQGRASELKSILNSQMLIHSNNMDYESAAIVRDQIKDLEQLLEEQKVSLPDSSINRDVLAIAMDERISSIQIFQMRSGKLVGRLGFTSDSFSKDGSLIVQRVMEEHYSQVDSVEIPPEILVQSPLPQQDFISEWLTELRGSKVNIINPKRSIKAELIHLVQRNAFLELSRIQQGFEQQVLELEDLAQVLELSYPPKRIEGYDISHVQGTDTVASQVVFIDGLPAKHHYRKYKIRDSSIRIGHSDDYKSLSEVIERRFRRWARLKKSVGDLSCLSNRSSSKLDTDGFNDWPDLIMIDGGKGQLSAVMNTLKQLDLHEDLSVCSLAKKKEELFVPGDTEPVSSDPDQLGLRLLRRLRDEAHRYAIGFHRKKRSARMTKSSLGGIPGIGSKKIRDLLIYFQSVEAIQMASIEEVSSVPGFGPKSALTVWTYFHPE